MSNHYEEEKYSVLDVMKQNLADNIGKWKVYKPLSGIICVDDEDKKVDGGQVLLMGDLPSEDEYSAYSRVAPASEQDYADPFDPPGGLWITGEALRRFQLWRDAEWEEEENDTVDETDWKERTLESMAVRGAMFESNGVDIVAPLIFCLDEADAAATEELRVVIRETRYT